jgi:DNA polymerase-3 subunit gamma/tau
MAALEALNDRRGKARPEPVGVAGQDLQLAQANMAPAEKKTELNPDLVGLDVAVIEKLPEPPPKIDVRGVWLVSGSEWNGDWPSLSATLPLRGVAQQLAQQSELVSCEVSTHVITLGLRVPLETLLASGSAEKLAAALSENFTVPVKVQTEIGAVRATAHAASLVERAARQDAAEVAIKSDQIVQGLMREFGATIVPGSVKPV